MKRRLLRVLPQTANADPEFALAARMWDGDVLFVSGDDAVKMTVRSGVVQGPQAAAPDTDAQIRIAAGDDGWQKMLMPVPPPFYQDLFGASIHHGFVLGGRIEDIGPYYPALRRLIELMRQATVAEEV